MCVHIDTHMHIDTAVQKIENFNRRRLLCFFSSPTNLHLLLFFSLLFALLLFFSLLFALLSHLFIPCMLVLCFLLKRLGRRNLCGSPELTNQSRIMATWVGNDPCSGSYELVRDTRRRTRFLVTMPWKILRHYIVSYTSKISRHLQEMYSIPVVGFIVSGHPA